MARLDLLPAKLDISGSVGDDLTVTFTVTENGSPWDATGATVTSGITDLSGTAVVTNFTTDASTGSLTLSLTDAQTTTLGAENYQYWVAVAKSGNTRRWVAGNLQILEDTAPGRATSSASLSITNGTVTLGFTSLVAPTAANISIADADGYFTSDEVESALVEMLEQNALVFDHFNRHADGSLSGKVPVVGPTWAISGAGTPTVTSGLLGNASSGYAIADCGATVPTMLACGVRYTNPSTANVMTMAWMTGATGSAFQVADIGCHFNWGPTNYSVTIAQGSTFYTLMSGTWSSPMVAGTTYPVTAYVEGGKLTITANGDIRTSAYDVRLTTLLGPIVWWQPITSGGAAAQIAWAYAATIPSGLTVPPFAYKPVINEGVFSKGQAVGNQELAGQVSIGLSTADNVSPAVNFGASTIRTYLTSAASSGQTQFIAQHPIPTGSSVILTGGTDGETVTTTGFPTGSGPYTHTATANLTKSHLSGASVVATPASTHRATMYLSMGSSGATFFLPDKAVLCAPNGNMYLGSALDTFFRRVSANIGGMGAGDSFQVDGTYNGGMLIMGAYYLWVDGSGRLRIKSGAPASDTDGTVVGTQV